MTIRLGQNEAFELKRGDSTTSIPVDGDARIVTDIELDDVANAAQMKGWYPDGDVTDSSQWTPTWDGTDGLRYAVRFSGRFSSTSTDHTASVLPFCSSTYGEDNSHISGIVVIPPHADMSGERYSVTSIADGNPSGMQNRLTEVIMPSTLTRIGDNAFFGCISLSSVTIGDGVTSIGDGAFYGCLNLNGIEIPGSVTDIGSSAFYRCISLTAVTLPESVTSVGVSAFEGCADLASIVVEGRTQSQASTLLANASVPQGCTVTTGVSSSDW